jgi:hypothetical protein
LNIFKTGEKNMIPIKFEFKENVTPKPGSLLKLHFLDASVDGVKKELSKSPNINLGGKTPLQIFLDEFVDCSSAMLAPKHAPSAPRFGLTPVAQKKMRDYFEIIKFLLDTGADLSTTNNNGDTLLHLVAENRFTVDIINFLVDAGASLGAENKNGDTPFDVAVGESKTALEGPMGVTVKPVRRNKI